MCSRYTVGPDPKVVAERFGASPAPGQRPRFNLAPSQEAPVLFAAPERRMTLLKWGLLPAWAKGPQAKPQINARAETVLDKPFFREAFRWRRALIPADGWYEWPKKGADKAPRYFSLKTGDLFAFAGLWEPGSFAMITTEPNPLVARFHDRMPAILAAADEAAWLDPKTPTARLQDLLRPFPSELLDARPVSPRIGSSAVDEPSLRDFAAQPQGELF